MMTLNTQKLAQDNAVLPSTTHADSLLPLFGQDKIVAIIRRLPEESLTQAVEHLYSAGIRLLEVAFNEEDSLATNATRISRICALNLRGLHLGAGTVRNPESVIAAADHGAEFILSPDTTEEVITKTKSLGLVSVPGAFSPTEVRRAHDLGGDIIKIFPAASLGPHYFKDILAPLPHIPLSAVGGINAKNAKTFIKSGALCVGVGSSLFPRSEDGTVLLPAIESAAKELIASLQDQ